MGVGGVGIVLIILRSVAADKRPAAFEHIRRRGQYRACAPVVVAKNGLQCRTAGEHITHIRHVVGVERTEVKRREFFATLEHTAHIRYLVGIEFTQVKFSKRWTVEHMAHIRHFGGIEIF